MKSSRRAARAFAAIRDAKAWASPPEGEAIIQREIDLAETERTRLILSRLTNYRTRSSEVANLLNQVCDQIRDERRAMRERKAKR